MNMNNKTKYLEKPPALLRGTSLVAESILSFESRCLKNHSFSGRIEVKSKWEPEIAEDTQAQKVAKHFQGALII